MLTTETTGQSWLTVNVTVTTPGEGLMPPPDIVVQAPPLPISASISLSSGLFPPVSAMFLIPGVASSPSSHSRTAGLCDAPISPEKWGLGGNSSGWVVSLQVASNVNWYRADAAGVSVGAAVAGGAVGVAGVSVGAIVASGATVSVGTSAAAEVGMAVAAGVVDDPAQALAITRMSRTTRRMPGTIRTFELDCRCMLTSYG
jgi:hypothetical protein